MTLPWRSSWPPWRRCRPFRASPFPKKVNEVNVIIKYPMKFSQPGAGSQLLLLPRLQIFPPHVKVVVGEEQMSSRSARAPASAPAPPPRRRRRPGPPPCETNRRNWRFREVSPLFRRRHPSNPLLFHPSTIGLAYLSTIFKVSHDEEFLPRPAAAAKPAAAAAMVSQAMRLFMRGHQINAAALVMSCT